MSVTVTRYGNEEAAPGLVQGADVIDLQPILEEQHLADEHGLRKVTAYVRDRRRNAKSDSAARVAKHREKRKEAGEMQVWLPAADAHRIKEAGGLDKLLTATREQAMLDARKAQPVTPDQSQAWLPGRSHDERASFWLWMALFFCAGAVAAIGVERLLNLFVVRLFS